MLDIGQVLQPRDKSDPVAQVVGIEGQSYMMRSPEFGPVWDMDTDALAAAYITDGHRVHIEPFDESTAWAKLSTERVSALMNNEKRRERRERELPSPEDVFAAGAKAEPPSESVKAESTAAVSASRRKLRRKS